MSSTTFHLRYYQQEAVSACWQYLRQQAGNPVVVLPTGAGKSLVIAQMCADVLAWGGKVIVLQHRKELIQQNANKILALLPGVDVGLHSSGLNRRDTEHDILVAGIQSVYKRAYDVGQRNVAIIDEVHLVPTENNGMYRHFLSELRSANERIRIAGLTATPYRLDSGPICRPDAIFQNICYSAPIGELIEHGYLCRLTAQPPEVDIDTSKLHVRAGEFISAECESLFDQSAVECVKNILAASEKRKSILIFCSGVQHAIHVSSLIRDISGEHCGIVTGDTIPLEREATLQNFAKRRIRFLANVDVLTTGFDAPCIDCIALLRATLSPGLYAQICGRGFRVFPGKDDCLILDFGGNIQRHGPLDAIDYGKRKHAGSGGDAPMKNCPNCEQPIAISATACPYCGLAQPIERSSANFSEADTESKILSEPETWDVYEAFYSVHHKKGNLANTPTLRVDYMVSQNGIDRPHPISEWVCLEHEHGSYAHRKAVKWWRERSLAHVPQSVEEAVEMTQRGAVLCPASITTIQDGHFFRIISTRIEGDLPAEFVNVEELDDIPF
jgi:DNA repair protein RadD